MSSNAPPHFVVVGRLRRTFLLPPTGRPYLDRPGGSALYTAAGIRAWEESIGLVARVGEDYPRDWIEEFRTQGFDTRGIQIMPESIDLREFLAYTSLHTRFNDNPVAHFARLELPFPKALFGYRRPNEVLDSRTQLSGTAVRQTDFPPDYLHATVVHFCPLEFLNHSLLPSLLRQAGFITITLDPSRGYMDPSFFGLIPSIVSGLTAFLVSEEKLRNLFQGRSKDLWEMAEAVGAYGCEMVVIKRGLEGQYLYDVGAKTRWEIPAYASRMVDPTGAGDAFNGGFIAGYRRTYYPLDAVLHANVSASLAVEGTGPFYALDALPGLADARMALLKQSVRKV